jgi:hypothetical protein
MRRAAAYSTTAATSSVVLGQTMTAGGATATTPARVAI